MDRFRSRKAILVLIQDLLSMDRFRSRKAILVLIQDLLSMTGSEVERQSWY